MKCYYEVLEVSRDANQEEIKSAYRKLALKWHPDKNLQNSEYANEQFLLVKNAYDILSDKQERAWYDRHRDHILRGSVYEERNLDVFQYFTSSCFEEYDDNVNGFYTIFRNIFEKIANEDMDFITKDEFCVIPNFGNSHSDYNEVVAPFYNYWISYSTKKSYVWLDPYKINDIRDRKIFKLAEKENNKIRQKARKERNEEIRSLVAFVKKRDKRVRENVKLETEKKIKSKQKHQLLRMEKMLQSKQVNESVYQPEWTKFDNVESELIEREKSLAKEFGEDISNSEDELSEQLDDNNVYCSACCKIFKTTEAFKNHEFSKKHKKNIEKLDSLLLDEDDNLSLNGDKCDIKLDEDDVLHLNEFTMENGSERVNNLEVTLNDKENLNSDCADFNETNSESDNVKLDLFLENNKSKSKQKSKISKVLVKNEEQQNTHTNDQVEIIDDLENSLIVTDFFMPDNKNKSKKKNRKSNIQHHVDDVDIFAKTETLLGDDSFAFNSSSKLKRKNKKISKKCNGTTSIDNLNFIEKVKVTSNNKKERQQQDEICDVDTNICCATCNSTFSSKNKLFDHLKKTNHGILLPNKFKRK